MGYLTVHMHMLFQDRFKDSSKFKVIQTLLFALLRRRVTELSNLCGLAQVRAVKKSCHAALVFSQGLSIWHSSRMGQAGGSIRGGQDDGHHYATKPVSTYPCVEETMCKPRLPSGTILLADQRGIEPPPLVCQRRQERRDAN